MLLEESSSSQIGVKQFRLEHCISYCCYDRESRQALLVDPVLGLMSEYREYIADHQLDLVCALDIHTRKDHFSASHLFKVGRPRESRDLIQLGRFEFRELEISGEVFPGWRSLSGAGLVFTGDLLWIGTSSGYVQLQAQEIERVFDSLPGSTVLFPAHDSNDLVCSLIQVEKLKNPDWSGNALTAPRESGIASISIEKYKNKIHENAKGSAFIDVREEAEFRSGHIPGTRNIPISEIGLHWDKLFHLSRIYVSCFSGVRSARAAKTLSYLGLNDVVNVSAGFLGWMNAGYSTKYEK